MGTRTITQTVTECDGCGKDLTGRCKDIYRMELKTEPWFEYHNERSRNVVKLEFCESCARNIKATLEKLEKELAGDVP